MKHQRLSGVVAPITILAAIAGVTPSSLAQSFTLMGFVPPRLTSTVTGLSADGTVAAGYDDGAGAKGFTWTAAGGRINFGLAFTSTSVVNGISGNGLAVVGNGPDRAFKWSQAGGYQNLGVLPGYQSSSARDANHDGSIVVGTLSNGSGSEPQAFRWTQATGMQGLGAGTSALAVSGDGTKVVGFTGPFGNRPFTWTTGAGLQFLPTLDGSISGYATGINHDGSIIVGRSGVELRGTLWMNGVPTDLTNGSMTMNLSASQVSDDGSVVAGLLNLGSGGSFAGVWTQGMGMMKLSDYLALHGVSIPAGFTLATCTAMSADGRTFAGYTTGIGPGSIQGFVATIPAPGTAALLGIAGLVTMRRRR
jgi:probable HAF family extracellular repeat protein